MSRALIYILSKDEVAINHLRHAADFIFCSFATPQDLNAAKTKRPPDFYLLDFDMDIPACDEYQPALGLASVQGLIPHEHVRGFILKNADGDMYRDWLLSQERLLEEKASLERQIAESFKTAMAAMSSMGEIGTAMRFLTEAFVVRDYKGLCDKLVSACEDYGLSSAAQIRIPGKTVIYSRMDSRADTETFTHMRDLGRILEFKQRMVVNYEYVSILIHNMPEDDGARGRTRDNIAILCEGANERVRSLLLEADNFNIQKGIQSALGGIQETVADLRMQSGSRPQSMQAMVNQAIEDMQCAFVHSALTADQENALLDPLLMLREAAEKEETAFGLDARLAGILATLESISIAKPH